MPEPKIGRILAASLHQAINELMPTRVEFYENWLTPGRFREGVLGRACITAVISFLRKEGAEYDAVVDRAGRYTADWTVETLSVVERALLQRLPRLIRVRVVLWIAARMIRGLHEDVGLRAVVRRGTVVVTVDGSLFCDVRAHTTVPLCRYYGAILECCLKSFDVLALAQPSQCRATGDGTCEFIIHIGERETHVGADALAAV